jgi:hypothetical protein
MTDKTFTELLRGANEALAHAQGKRNLSMTTFPSESMNGGAAARPQPARQPHKRHSRAR